jgi:pyruvate,water dikinase
MRRHDVFNMVAISGAQLIRRFAELTAADLPSVGGKNASLGEMIRALPEAGVRVPDGFALTAEAYWSFVDANELRPRLRALLDGYAQGRSTLTQTGAALRKLFYDGAMPPALVNAVREAYATLSARYGVAAVDVAVRSSATAEDLPEASFAGQQESFLNVRGSEALLDACRRCFASLFTDRAISYREQHRFAHLRVALSVGVQKMVRSDRAVAGVMFTIDTETGFPNVVLIDAAWGLGEAVVKGIVTPDEYRVFKPLLYDPARCPIVEKSRGDKRCKVVYADEAGAGTTGTTRTVDTTEDERTRLVLSDNQVLSLARWALAIERHYGRPMDIEWAVDGESGEIFIVQARPETVESRKSVSSLKRYRLLDRGRALLTGAAIGEAIAAGKAFVLLDLAEAGRFEDGGILVTDMTDPDWVPLMRRAAGIITDRGGRTSHAAIVSRELGVPAVVGTTRGTTTLRTGQELTLSCAEGETGFVYPGRIPFEERDIDLSEVPETRTRIMINLADPDAALRWWRLPCRGVGLARMEFIINRVIKVHPMALVRFDQVRDPAARRSIDEMTRGFSDKTEYFVEHLSRGIAKIAASRYPDPVIVRTSDFKTNEYAKLIGGRDFERDEVNPMLGLRGASRYYSDRYRAAFTLECRAIKLAREHLGFDNIIVMIPFCRTLAEADRVIALLAEQGLQRGENGLELYVMAEIPNNVFLAERFAQRFDGFSIGSNDLTQLVLGVDRDSAELAPLFDERDEGVKCAIAELITRAHAVGRKVGICGQAPSDHPGFAEFLVAQGIDSISLNPDSVIGVTTRVAAAEASGAPAAREEASAWPVEAG